MRRLFFFAIFLGAFPQTAHADVNVEPAFLREYQLPGTFNASGATINLGAGGSTIISAVMGSTPETASCGIVTVTDTDATLVDYKYEGQPSQCLGVIPHPNGGVFVRGNDPTAMQDAVTGFTAFINADGTEEWTIPDQRLVDGTPEPAGPGQFQGGYESAHPALAYSAQLDKLLAFTVGRLTIGQETKFISQAHVVNAGSGQLRVNGQTFGQTGVGIVGGAVSRNSDGNYLLYYYSNGSQGAFFYEYDGRTNISFFEPRGEEWDDRFVRRMIYERDLLHLLWTPSDMPDAQTRVTVTTDTQAELWSVAIDPEYQFRNGTQIVLGVPQTMWVAEEHTVILYNANDELFLRVLDINGEDFGVAKLTDLTDFPPLAIVLNARGKLNLLNYDANTRFVREYELTLTDIKNFDPEVGLDGLPGDIGIPDDIGISDVLEAAGCCATTRSGTPRIPSLLLLIGLFVVVRRRRK